MQTETAPLQVIYQGHKGMCASRRVSSKSLSETCWSLIEYVKLLMLKWNCAGLPAVWNTKEKTASLLYFGINTIFIFFSPTPLPQHSPTAVTGNFYKGTLSALQQTVNIFMNGKARHLQVVHTQTCTFNLEGSLSWTTRKKLVSAIEHVHF